MTIKRASETAYRVEGVALPHAAKQAIDDLDRAAQNKAFQGSAPPDDRSDIEDEYRHARRAMALLLAKLYTASRP